MQNENKFKSKDLYLAAALIASGYKIHNLEPISNKTFLFVFAIKQEIAKKLEDDFWQRELLVSARDYADAINELKTRIYQV